MKIDINLVKKSLEIFMIQNKVCGVATVLTIGSLFWLGLLLSPLTSCAAQTHTVKLRPDGVVLKNGRPFFPIGFYHVSWNATPAAQLKHLREIAAADFNLVHASATDLQSYRNFLREANTLGISVISEHHFDPVSFVQRFKNEPAILAWNLADDADNGKRSPAQVMTLHRKIRAADPNHPTYISGYSKGLQQFARCADILGRQSYPIRHHTTAELTSVSSDMTEISSVLVGQPPRTLFANLQLFPWAIAKPGQQGDAPTPLEVRNMTYQALLGGAKGILYYTYYDEAWYLPEHSELWEGLKTLNQELKSLSPWFLEGRYQPLKSTRPTLKGGVWVLKQRALLIVVNTSQREDFKEQVLNSWTQGQNIEPLAHTLPVHSFSGKKLTLTIPAKTVQVYEIY
jgi:hypothetical protein